MATFSLISGGGLRAQAKSARVVGACGRGCMRRSGRGGPCWRRGLGAGVGCCGGVDHGLGGGDEAPWSAERLPYGPSPSSSLLYALPRFAGRCGFWVTGRDAVSERERKTGSVKERTAERTSARSLIVAAVGSIHVSATRSWAMISLSVSKYPRLIASAMALAGPYTCAICVRAAMRSNCGSEEPHVHELHER